MHETRRWMRHALSLLSVGVINACSFAPDYHAPTFIYPNGWRGHGNLIDGKPADAASKGRWWTVFNDPTLNRLEERLLTYNPDLQAQAELFTQARDVARETEAQLYPQGTGLAGMSNNRASQTKLWRMQSSLSPIRESSVFYSGAASWEPDFWDKIRNTVRMQKNLAQVSAAQYANMRLLLTAELASDYIGLRGLDAQRAVYDSSINYYRKAVEITHLRQAGAISAGLDVSRAENQLYATLAARSYVLAQRQILEHALAVLVNLTPASLDIDAENAQELSFPALDVFASLPSQLLQRRPDIAAAERTLAAMSRAIGVARAAFYPDISFSATGGFMNNGFDLANLANSMWSYGVQAVEPVFTGGLRRVALQRAWAQYRQAADDYRSTVLSAFQDVEDALSETHMYRAQELQEYTAVAAALRTQKMTMALYTGGLTNYLDVVVAQQAALVARINAVRAQTLQRQASVRLIRALGGGWNRTRLPKIKEIDPIHPFQYEGLHHATPAGDVQTKGSLHSNDLGPGVLPEISKQPLTGRLEKR